MASENLVIGHFEHLDDTLKGIRTLREQGFNNIELFSAFPNHELEEEMYKNVKRSPVRRCTFFGGLTGLSLAFLMTI